MDYANGKIYKLVSNMTEAIYIGSTTQPLAKRKHCHKASYNRWINGKGVFISSCELFKLGGTIDIILIEEFACKSKMELERRERYHIERTDCVNKCIPVQTHEERLKYEKEYRAANREAILEYKKVYRGANREAILEYQKEYYELNRDAISEYYEANKEKILDRQKERVNCPHCQKEMNRNSLSRHIKTQH
jgi:hypothetical protein